MESGTIAYIGISSNLDDPPQQCRRAVACLDAAHEVQVLRCSSLYRTEPIGGPPQPDCVNAVCEIQTTLSARGLFSLLKLIEQQMKRVKTERWGPRVIDLDLLLFGQEVVGEEDLIIPHPRMHRRAFVLVPLAEIASYVIHPAFGVSVKGLIERLEDGGRVERLEELRSAGDPNGNLEPTR